MKGRLVLLLLLLTDVLSDFVLSLHLLSLDEAGWGGGLLLASLLLPLLLLPLYSALSRYTGIQQRVSLEDLLAVSPFIHSAPAALVQLVVVWSGVVEGEGWLWCQYLSLVLSLASLSLASFTLQEEPGPRIRQVTAGLNILINGSLRLGLLSVTFKLDPVASTVFLVFGYFVELLHHLTAGDGRHSIFLAFCNLFIPTGQNHQMCPSSAELQSSSELERVKLNEAGLAVRLGRFLAVSALYNSALLIFYLVIVELRPAVSTIELLSFRSFTITVPALLFLTSAVLSSLYYRQVRGAADSQPHLTPPSSPSRPMRCESRDVESGVVGPPINGGGADGVGDGVGDGGGDGGGDTGEGGGLYPALPTAPDPPFNPHYEIPVGNRRCENPRCVTCSRMLEGQTFSSRVTGRQYSILPAVSCTSEQLIYLITCSSCDKQYVGKTEQSLRQRHYGHRREIEAASSALGQHFGPGGCGPDCLVIQVIELCPSQDLLPAREGFWQHELASFAPHGINIRDELGGKLKS